MSRLAFAAALTGSLVAAPALWAEPSQSGAKAKVEIKIPEIRHTKRAFSGNEFRLAAMNNVNADCSSGPVPDVRVLVRPANGELRIEEARTVVDRDADNRRAHCNGKEVDARAIHYKSAAGFVGQDKIAVEVDFKTGTVRRYTYVIDVR
jgi:hypothetical protein